MDDHENTTFGELAAELVSGQLKQRDQRIAELEAQLEAQQAAPQSLSFKEWRRMAFTADDSTGEEYPISQLKRLWAAYLSGFNHALEQLEQSNEGV